LKEGPKKGGKPRDRKDRRNNRAKPYGDVKRKSFRWGAKKNGQWSDTKEGEMGRGRAK